MTGVLSLVRRLAAVVVVAMLLRESGSRRTEQRSDQ
jgi:hypothetical protein